MKVLLLYEYPPGPGGLATQGDLLLRGLRQIGVEAHAVGLESAAEKEWYYHWFRPDLVVGVGFWGHAPDIIFHPQQHGMMAVPWLVADGYIANYRDAVNDLPLILVTSRWVKEVYIRDGINSDIIEVLPVGCDTDAFVPRELTDERVSAVRNALGLRTDRLTLLTVGGDAASKGAQEVMRALAQVRDQVPDWQYVCKVWPQPRTSRQTARDLALAEELGLADRVIFVSCRASRNYMPYLIAACDIYAAPSRLDGFGMPQMEAGACAKPVIGIRAMAMLDTLVHEETALLAGVAEEIRVTQKWFGKEAGYRQWRRLTFDPPLVTDYRASVPDIADHLVRLMNDADLRARLGAAGRRRAVEHFDYRVVARRFVEIVSARLGVS